MENGKHANQLAEWWKSYWAGIEWRLINIEYKKSILSIAVECENVFYYSEKSMPPPLLIKIDKKDVRLSEMAKGQRAMRKSKWKREELRVLYKRSVVPQNAISIVAA